MYGKFFASAFTGSMFGSGPEVFSTWAYVIANTRRDSHVELNIRLMAVAIGCSEDSVKKAIAFLCNPDPGSRSKELEGKRLLKVGEYLYEVVNHQKYREIRNEDDRREYFRQKKAESRARKDGVKAFVKNGQSKSIVSTHADAEEEAEKDISSFELFWSRYPKKEAKKECRKEWLKGSLPLNLIMQALDWQLETRKWIDGYAPNPLTYIHQERWNDHPEPVRQKSGADI